MRMNILRGPTNGQLSVYLQNRGFSYNKPRGNLGEKEVVQSTRHMLGETVNLKALNIGKREHG